MASSSSSSLPRTWRYRVFTSFHGPDVRKAFVSHLRKQFNQNGISMFDDQEMERSHTIAHALTQAIRESRIAIVVLSKYYASSKWCLDELVEIFKCKEEFGQIVMTVFYEVDPSDVRKQTGDFGRVFNETCAGRTEEERRVWSQALTDAGNIAGEHNWDNESKMIEKIAGDVSNKLNTTVSTDFEDMVGIEAHLEKMLALLRLEDEDEALVVGIFGPAGIGKTTIARVLHSRLSGSFQLSCFMENVSVSYKKGLDNHGMKLSLQEQLLSNILNQNGKRKYHLGVIQERLHDQKVLIILDDVDDLEQLEALADETSWFGPGSRIIVTTKDQNVLEQHDINNKYYVNFPTKEDAREILCRKAFRQTLALEGYQKLVERVLELCDNLPLGICVIGSTLRGKKEEDWECILRRLENSLHRKIEGVLRIGYDNLHKDDQLLFLHIAIFFNYQDEDHVIAMLSEKNLDVRFGLNTLAKKSLIQISTERKIVMHTLLQQAGREAIQRQVPWKRQILIDNDEICNVMEDDSGNGSVMGISLDKSTLSRDVYICPRAFKRIRNLRFLSIYNTCFDGDNRVHVPEEMNFPAQLRLLHWEEYPAKCLPPKFRPEYLVELKLHGDWLEKLWEGIQPLTNLKRMSLSASMSLKELPDLSHATNLVRLDVDRCFSLVEIPSSFENLRNLNRLDLTFCLNLQNVPTHFNLESLKGVNMLGCYQLKKFPDICRNITTLAITGTLLKDLPESISLWSHLQILFICGNGTADEVVAEANPKRRSQVASNPWIERASYIKDLDVDIEKIPDCIKDLHGLKELHILGCLKLASLPELPTSLKRLIVDDCESLETIMPFPFESAIEGLYFTNCLKLGEEARRVINQQSSDAWLPGRNVPKEFDHQAIGNSLIIPSGTKEYRLCVLVSPKQQMKEYADLLCREQGFPGGEQKLEIIPKVKTEHMFTRHVKLHDKLESEVLLEFSTTSKDIDIIGCGFKIFTDKTSISNESISEETSDRRNGFDKPRGKGLKSFLSSYFSNIKRKGRLRMLCVLPFTSLSFPSIY